MISGLLLVQNKIRPRCKRFYLGAKFLSSQVISKLQLEDELKKEGVISWVVRGLVGRMGEPIRVRLEIRLEPFLEIKLASLYNERTCTI
jgi:predicted thioredoxin/glutaredoxin